MRSGEHDAEFALLVSDRYQGHGLGVTLLQQLLRIAHDEGIRVVAADILPENVGMLRICERLGFSRPKAQRVRPGCHRSGEHVQGTRTPASSMFTTGP